MTNNETAQHLEAAAQLIEQSGWCQGNWQNPQGNLSMMGAVAVAIYGELPEWLASSVGGPPPEDDDDRPWLDALYIMAQNLQQDPEAWNDFESRQESQVIARLRLVAAGGQK